MYRERGSELVAGAVVWRHTPRAGAPGPGRVLPDGCMDLLWLDGALVVAGPDTTAQVGAGTAPCVGVRFAPGSAPGVLGVPGWTLADQRVPLAELWPHRRVALLTQQLSRSADPVAALELVAARAAEDAGARTGAGARARAATVPGLPEAVLAGLRSGWPVHRIARELAFSERQLHRHCRDAFGYGAKTLGRVLRFGRALELARAGVPYAEVAQRCGYADQPHLARDVRALAGVPLGALLAAERPAADA